jgi:hypothetical protein
MAATTGYSAAPISNDVILSYGVESAWGVLPSVQFQAIRFTSESLSGTKKRDRPAEAGQYEVSAAVTTEEKAGGNIAFALSYGTYDDMLSCVWGQDWQAAQSITAILTDMTITATTGVLTSTLSTKFSNLAVGQWIRMLGWTNAANNGYFRITAKASNQNITLSLPSGTYSNFVTETSAAGNAGIRASTMLNSSLFKSLHFQKKLAASQFLRYPGVSFPNFTLSGGVGQFLNGSFDLMSQSESKSTSDASTGAVLAAPAGRVHDPVTNFIGSYWNNAVVDATVDSFSLTVARENQSQQYGMGNASAVGVTPGRLMASGMLKMFFKNYTYYDLFKAETAGALTIITRDAAGAAYAITVEAANLMNPKILAGGPNQPVYAEFEVEGNPLSTGGTVRLDRLAAS